MNKRILQGTRVLDTENNNELTLEYYIVEKRTSNNTCYYGIEIDQVQGIKDTVLYKKLILSECKSWVLELVEKFIRNGVTPITMEYIIDDIMTQLPC